MVSTIIFLLLGSALQTEMPGAKAFADKRIQALLAGSVQTIENLRARYSDTDLMTWNDNDRKMYLRAKAIKTVLLFAPDFYRENIEMVRTSERIIAYNEYDHKIAILVDRRDYTGLDEYLKNFSDETIYQFYFYFDNARRNNRRNDKYLQGIAIIVELNSKGQVNKFNIPVYNRGLHFFGELEDVYGWAIERYKMMYSDYIRTEIMKSLDRSNQRR